MVQILQNKLGRKFLRKILRDIDDTNSRLKCHKDEKFIQRNYKGQVTELLITNLLIEKINIIYWDWESPAEVNISISIQYVLGRAGEQVNT